MRKRNKRVSELTPEQLKKKRACGRRAYYRRRARLTPEELDRERAKQRKRHADLSPEKYEQYYGHRKTDVHREQERRKAKKIRKEMDKEERRRKLEEKRRIEKERWENMTPDQRWLRNRIAMLKQRYGMTMIDYEEMIRTQDGLCALCDKPLGEAKRPHPVDHDHSQKGRQSVRGIVHHRCNIFIGFIEKSGLSLDRIRKYLFHTKEAVNEEL